MSGMQSALDVYTNYVVGLKEDTPITYVNSFGCKFENTTEDADLEWYKSEFEARLALNNIVESGFFKVEELTVYCHQEAVTITDTAITALRNKREEMEKRYNAQHDPK